MEGNYRYLAKSRAAFVSQVVNYIAKGYYFYVVCKIPEKKDPELVDAKMLDLYGVQTRRWQRVRRNLKDAAAVHYLRFDRTFVLMVTKGRHDAFYRDHGQAKRDVRRQALYVFGYCIRRSLCEVERRYRIAVRLDRPTYDKLKSHLVAVSTWESYRSRERMEREFAGVPYQAYGPVIGQLQVIRRAVNRARRRRGFELLDSECIPKKRYLTKVFSGEEVDAQRETYGSVGRANTY